MRYSLIAALAIVFILSVAATPGRAVVTNQALYKLGEAGTVSGGSLLPQDSVSTHDFTMVSGSGNSIIASDRFNSTAAMRFNGAGYFNVDSDFVPSDNFAVEMWARVGNTNQTNNSFFTTAGGPANSTLKFHVHNGNWAASLHNIAWIGGAGGAGQGITANTWTHLAVVRNNGVSSFYIDGVAQTPSITQAPLTTLSLHMGVTPGGATRFFGDLDEVRIFTFDPNTDDPTAQLAINLPEPATLSLVAVGGLTLLARRRRRVA